MSVATAIALPAADAAPDAAATEAAAPAAAVRTPASDAHAAMQVVEALAERSQIDEQAFVLIANGLRAAHVASEAHPAPPPAPAAEAASAPVDGAVPAHELTPAQLRRQEAERRWLERQRVREELSQNLAMVAESILGSVAPVCLLFAFGSLWLLLHVSLSILLKQAATPPTERFSTCITNHALVQSLQFFALAVGTVLGHGELTYIFLGHTVAVVQPKRLFWLLWLAVFEGLVIMPLCGPEIAPSARSVAPLYCHAGQPPPPNADQEQRLSILLAHATFFQAAFLVTLSGTVYFFLGLGWIAKRSAGFIAPLVAVCTVLTVGYLQYMIYLARRAQNIFIGMVALFDKCLADTVWATVNTALGTAVAAAKSDDDGLRAPGGLYGPRVMWSVDELECSPMLMCTIVWCLVISAAVLGASVYVH